MSDHPDRYTVRPGRFIEAAEWVWNRYCDREHQRLIPMSTWCSVADPTEMLSILPSYRRLRMGRRAFFEAQHGRWTIVMVWGHGSDLALWSQKSPTHCPISI